MNRSGFFDQSQSRHTTGSPRHGQGHPSNVRPSEEPTLDRVTKLVPEIALFRFLMGIAYLCLIAATLAVGSYYNMIGTSVAACFVLTAGFLIVLLYLIRNRK